MKSRRSRRYTDDDIIEQSKHVISIAGLLSLLGLRPAGGNYYTMKRNLQRLQVDTSHWKCQGWSKDEQKKDWVNYSRNESIKPHLIRARGHKCEECGNI